MQINLTFIIVFTVFFIVTFILMQYILSRPYFKKGPKEKPKCTLPPGWMAYEMGQDLVTGSWYMQAICINTEDTAGKPLVVFVEESLSLETLLIEVNYNIKHKIYHVDLDK